MLYFAYGSNLNARAVAEWCRLHGHRPIALQGGKPGVLDNYRLGFPIYSEYWGGGIADVVYDPGKYVMGVLFDLTEADLDLLDQKVGREVDRAGNEIGVYKRVGVKVAPLGKGELGRAGCATFLSEPRFEGLTAIFEGPGVEGKAPSRSGASGL